MKRVTAFALAGGRSRGLSVLAHPRSVAAVPFAGFLARAVWAVCRVRPVANVRRLGFTEVGVELLSGLWIAASYWLW